MIVLDHNIPENQAAELRRWRIHFQQIGHEVGRPEWDDMQEILRHLHQAKWPTLFTRDVGFFRRSLCHPNYNLTVITTPVFETAWTIRRLLRHPGFRTRARRCGKVLKLSQTKIAYWEIGKERLKYIP